MLRKVDYIEDLMLTENFVQFDELDLRYYASDIMESLDCEDSEEMNEAIARVLQVCHSLDIPLGKNFKRIYRYDGDRLCIDWKLSSLACYLLMINGNPCNPNVARAQLFFAARRGRR